MCNSTPFHFGVMRHWHFSSQSGNAPDVSLWRRAVQAKFACASALGISLAGVCGVLEMFLEQDWPYFA